MSLALFHEYHDSSQTVEDVVSGSFTQSSSTDFITKCGNRIVLYSTQSGINSDKRLRTIKSVTFQAQLHAIAVMPFDQSCDGLVCVFRHGIVSLLSYDPNLDEFKTVNQVCLKGDSEMSVDSLSTSPYVVPFVRVHGSYVAVLTGPNLLSVVNMNSTYGDESPNEDPFSVIKIPIRLGGSKIQLSCVDDVAFLSTSGSNLGGSLLVAVLGKNKSHAWEGRAHTVGWSSSVVRVISIDFAQKDFSVLWSFENLPTSCWKVFDSSGEIIVVGSESVSYCTMFGNVVTGKIDASSVPINLGKSRSVLLGSGKILFALANGEMSLCMHNDTGVVWVPVVVPTVVLHPSCIALSRPAQGTQNRILLVGSTDSDSVLFLLTEVEDSIPASGPSVGLNTEFSNPIVKTLVDQYHHGLGQQQLSVSVDLGVVDSIPSVGKIVSLVQAPSGETNTPGPLVYSTSANKWFLHDVSWDSQISLLFETKLKSRIMGLGPSARVNEQSCTVLIAENNTVLVIDSTKGLKERCVVVADEGVGAIVQTAWAGELLCIVGTNGMVTVDVTTTDGTSGVVDSSKVFYGFQESAEKCDITSTTNGLAIARLVGEREIAVILWNPEKEPVSSPMSRKSKKQNSHTIPESYRLEVPSEGVLQTLHVTVSNDQRVHVTVTDTFGSLFLFDSDTLTVDAKYISLCRAVIGADDGPTAVATSTCLSITDVMKRPVEMDPSIAGFAKQIRVKSAELHFFTETVLEGVEDGGSPQSVCLLIVLIEGRPPLVYKKLGDGSTTDSSSSSSRPIFKLLVFESPFLCDGRSSFSTRVDAFVDGNCGLLLRVNAESCVTICVNPARNEIFAHNISSLLSPTFVQPFEAQFVKTNALLSIEEGSVLRLYARNGGQEEFSQMESLFGGMFCRRAFEAQSSENLEKTTTVNTDCLSVAVSPMGYVALAHSTSSIKVTTKELPDEVVGAISLDTAEMVTDMCFASSVFGLGGDVLAVATTYMLGEEAPVQGRVLLFRIEPNGGCKQIYSIEKKSGVTLIRDWNQCLAIGLDHRLMFYQWDPSAGRLRGVGMYDVPSVQITSIAFTKNYIAVGDIMRGIQFLRWKEDPVIDYKTGLTLSMAASIQFLAKSTSGTETISGISSIVNMEILQLEKSAGIVSIDQYGNLDLHVFSPMHYGANLKPSFPFQLPSPAISISKIAGHLESSAIIGTASGSLCQLTPVSEADHHLVSSLNGLMVALLPHVGGVNPRLKHVAVGRTTNPGGIAVAAIESVDLLLFFLYLSTPLQAEIASRMKQPIDSIMRSVVKFVIFFAQ